MQIRQSRGWRWIVVYENIFARNPRCIGEPNTEWNGIKASLILIFKFCGETSPVRRGWDGGMGCRDVEGGW